MGQMMGVLKEKYDEGAMGELRSPNSYLGHFLVVVGAMGELRFPRFKYF